MIQEIRLSPKGIKPVRNGHPWVFRNALGAPPRPATLPASVHQAVQEHPLVWDHTQPAFACDPSGRPLGWGLYNGSSRLALRIITRNPEIPIRGETFFQLLREAVERRSELRRDRPDGAVRLVFGEADGFPGLVADLLGRTLVLELSGAFAWDNRQWIQEELTRLVNPQGVYLSPDRDLLGREGVSGPFQGQWICPGGNRENPENPENPDILVEENGLLWHALPEAGQKTGFYCDQRENRRWVGDHARGARVLDAFCYHGGFGLTALAGGASSVVCADSSAAALRLVEANRVLQQAPADRLHVVKGDLFELLRTNAVPQGLESFDLVVLDPPKLVPARQHRDAGLRAYKDLNLAALQGMRSGSRLVTFSCSGAISRDDFRTALAWAAADAGRAVRVEGVLSQGADHPVPLHFPEAEYLKGFVLRVD
ncbi:SAM-dependent methyltransferase /23S rRNA m(5)C-1962 methyltransferase [Alkalispirochaeta americana]|uniref:SAM-dependent methyltransferase /23S rRNA m(5)C-1962 methyltransferase n=1 Tax=Alkalispirochaeta americana TaxID=159291 RepID=A0A1N6WZB1_9SPIO|nr:class I SAM-dependent rRNA methyltransferase [Alkalispirochaeta americana]SIQ95361.1 SAM-dependent methyltransferase /23S rRNA m(5)C-1962 methyltransferase [Alkalispirochaeta americana]